MSHLQTVQPTDRPLVREQRKGVTLDVVTRSIFQLLSYFSFHLFLCLLFHRFGTFAISMAASLSYRTRVFIYSFSLSLCHFLDASFSLFSYFHLFLSALSFSEPLTVSLSTSASLRYLYLSLVLYLSSYGFLPMSFTVSLSTSTSIFFHLSSSLLLSSFLSLQSLILVSFFRSCNSVTRFGQFSPLWLNVKSLWQFLMVNLRFGIVLANFFK